MPQTIQNPANTAPEDNDKELVPQSDPRSRVISINPARMGGTPCFVGSRVPIRRLWDYLEGGKSVAQFLKDFEGVSREQCRAVLEMAFERLLEGLPKVDVRKGKW